MTSIEKSNEKYLENLKRVLQSSEAYENLFIPEEQDTLKKFNNLAKLPQILLTRMFFRKRIFFNKEHLETYVSTEDKLENCLNILQKTGLVHSSDKVLLDPREAKLFLGEFLI